MSAGVIGVHTRRGIDAKVRTLGDPSLPALLYLHGAGGLMAQEPLLDELSGRFRVLAPEWPGFGEEMTEGLIEDMLDFTLHGWDLVDALGLERPYLAGHSMGGMIAAEMAALNPGGIAGLALIGAAGVWLDELPVPDIFAMVPFELAEHLFVDPAAGEKVLTAGMDFSDDDALKQFLVGNARRMGTAGKILFPIPNRRLSKRLYRVTAPTVLVWGEHDRLFPSAYAARYRELLSATDARIETIADAAHMLPYEQPVAVGAAVSSLLG